MKGIGTDSKLLRSTLVNIPVSDILHVRESYRQQFKRDLIEDIESETSNSFEKALVAIARGPLEQDVHALHEAMSGLGTKEDILNDVLLGRKNADLHAIIQRYNQIHSQTKSLKQAIEGDLSMKTERLFLMVLGADRQEETTPVNPQTIDADTTELQKAMESRTVGTDQLTVCHILTNRSNGQIRAIAHSYEQKYHAKFKTVIEKNFSDHMKDALLDIVRKATDPVLRDAEVLAATMDGVGTRDTRLIHTLVSIHWNRDHMGSVTRAYKATYHHELVDKVKKETSGNYEDTLVDMIKLGSIRY